MEGKQLIKLWIAVLFVVQSFDAYVASSVNSLKVDLTLIHGAAAQGAVCLDGTLPGYYIDRGFGSGANNWLVQLQGGKWCYSIKCCIERKSTPFGSSKYMEKQATFEGILSNTAEENPDFYNWNRVKINYCDGASFSGEGEIKAAGERLYFRGQRIWLAAMEELMSKGMRHAHRALLTGTSAGGLSCILHCDEFRDLFPNSTQVKCLSDAGMFLDAIDISGGRTLRDIYAGVVKLQGVEPNLPKTCTNRLDPTSCFFPANLISDIRTPLFILNSAYDASQFRYNLAPNSTDPTGEWSACKTSIANVHHHKLNSYKMLKSLKGFATKHQTGLFINSCFVHCQTRFTDTWFAEDSPALGNRRIAEAVGDWYFERSRVKDIDCPYPCDNTCPKTQYLASMAETGCFTGLRSLKSRVTGFSPKTGSFTGLTLF